MEERYGILPLKEGIILEDLELSVLVGKFGHCLLYLGKF
jgi:hypothetical protein